MSGTHGAGLYKPKNKCDIACIDLEDGGIRPGVVLCFCMCVCVFLGGRHLWEGVQTQYLLHWHWHWHWRRASEAWLGMKVLFSWEGKGRFTDTRPDFLLLGRAQKGGSKGILMLGARSSQCGGVCLLLSGLEDVGRSLTPISLLFPYFPLVFFPLSLRLSPFPGGLLREFSLPCVGPTPNISSASSVGQDVGVLLFFPRLFIAILFVCLVGVLGLAFKTMTSRILRAVPGKGRVFSPRSTIPNGLGA